MKSRTLTIVFAAICLLAPVTAQGQTLPPDIEKSKVLRVALNTGYPPLEMRDPKTNEIIGFDIDLAAAIAKVLGVKIEYQDGAFENMTPALQSGRVDMIMSGFYDIPKRRPMFEFIDYLKAGAQFYTLTSLSELQKLTDLCGKTITTTRGTSYPDTVKAWSEKNCVAAGKEPITVMVDTDLGQQLTNLKTERAVGGGPRPRGGADDRPDRARGLPAARRALFLDAHGHGLPERRRQRAEGCRRRRAQEGDRRWHL